MSTLDVTETCGCGATFRISGYITYVKHEIAKWRTDHQHPEDAGHPAVLHVMPVGDTLEHTSDPGCLCGPEARSIDREDGTTGTLFVHHSLDGREISE